MEFYGKSKKVSKYAVKNNDTRIDSPQSILTLIEEKNKIIESLKKQVVGQKLQLSYYLNNMIDDNLIKQFKKGCLPTYVDENVRINIAMCKFYRETQQKSPIRNLFEQMFDIDRRLHATLNQQENMVQIVLDIIMKFAQNCMDGDDAESQLKKFLIYFNQFDVFRDLLVATKNVQNDLNSMKISCNRLVVIEDERNALVDHVYSRPMDQQACVNYVMSMISDRKALENELRDIKNELQAFMEEIPMEVQGNDILMKVKVNKKNPIAIDLERYENELMNMRSENNILNNKIRTLQKLLDSKAEMEGKVMELEKKCETLTNRYNNQEWQNMKPLEIRAMEAKINKLQEKIILLKTQSMELKALKKNLAYYKSQVEHLEKEKRTIEREKVEIVNNLNTKLEGNKEVVDLLKKQIQYLLLLLYYMREDGKNKKTMEEMNHAISIILNDIDVLLLKSADKRESIVNCIADDRNNQLDKDKEDSMMTSTTNEESKYDKNEMDFKNDYYYAEEETNRNHMLPTNGGG